MIRSGQATLLICCFFLTGCLYPVAEKIDGVVCDLSLQPRDLQWNDSIDAPRPPSHDGAGEIATSEYAESAQLPGLKSAKDDPPKGPSSRPSRLSIPRDLQPGGIVKPLVLPPPTEENRKLRDEILAKTFPPLPEVGAEPTELPLESGKPLTLTDLQRLAIANNPRIKQATARVEEARGRAIQAGLMPNPVVGFESDTIGTTGGAGYVGGFVEQTIKTVNKLQLSRAAAVLDLKLAELDLYNAQAELATKVREGYFSVLVAREMVRLYRALVRLTTEMYQYQVDRVRKGGLAAPYEATYLRALAFQARASLIQARNRRIAAWKQLAASMGVPGMPPTQLDGRLDVPIPLFDHAKVLATALTRHTEILKGQTALVQAEFELELARKTPIPDVNVRVMVQKDTTAPPFLASPSVAVGMPIPVWDRNQGTILAAQAKITRVGEDVHQARVDLTSRLAVAFEKYQNNRILIGYYRDQILPDLIRVYQGIYDRYQQDPGGQENARPEFAELIVAQENLAQAVEKYLSTLGGLWESVVEVADVLQTFDLFGVAAETYPIAPIPDLDKLPALPCSHPCSPIPEAHQRVIDRSWPDVSIPVGPLPALSEEKSVLPAPRPIDKRPSGKSD